MSQIVSKFANLGIMLGPRFYLMYYGGDCIRFLQFSVLMSLGCIWVIMVNYSIWGLFRVTV